MAERKLIDLDGTRSKSPFPQCRVLQMLRDDQIPRFYGALTDPEVNTVVETLDVMRLHGSQDRVDTEKVSAMAGATSDIGGEMPMVVRINPEWGPDSPFGMGYHDVIIDGHHRIAAAWVRGEDSVQVRVKDLREPSNAMKSRTIATGKLLKADESLGLALGWAIVSTENGEPYYDTQDDHIPVDVMAKAAADFMGSARTVDLQHSGIMANAAPNNHGQVVFAMPWTADIAKAFGIETGPVEGLMIAIRPNDPAVLAKFADGSLTGFSIGGKLMEVEDAA